MVIVLALTGLIGVFIVVTTIAMLVTYIVPIFMLIYKQKAAKGALELIEPTWFSEGRCAISTGALSTPQPINHDMEGQPGGFNQQAKQPINGQLDEPVEGYQTAPSLLTLVSKR